MSIRVPFILLFLLFAFELRAEPPCANGSAPGVFEQLADVGQQFLGQVRSGAELLEMEKRLARLHSPACEGKIWPNFKLVHTPLQIIDAETEAVYEFNRGTMKLEFKRRVTAADLNVKMFSSDESAAGGGTASLEFEHFKPFVRPVLPPGQQNPMFEQMKKRLCFQPKLNLMNFVEAHSPQKKLNRSDEALTLLAHENFHKIDQNPASVVHQHSGACQWHGMGNDVARNIDPSKLGPVKLIRQNIVSALRLAFEAEKGSAARLEALAQVKAWATKLKSEYGEMADALTEVDRGEGSAEYAGVMANTFGKLGCDPSPTQLKAALVERIERRIQPLPTPVDAQGYLIGGIAGFLLDEIGSSPNWKSEVTKGPSRKGEKAYGRSPLELLLASDAFAGVPTRDPVPDPVLNASEDLATANSQCYQDAAKAVIDRVAANPRQYVLVQIEREVGFMGGGFYLEKGSDGATVEVSPEASSQGALSFQAADIVQAPNYCGGTDRKAKYVLVPAEAIRASGKVEYQKGITQFSGSVPPVSGSKQSWNGVPVVCRGP